MNSVMTLAIFDQNAYFAMGLATALTAHFHARGIKTRRVDSQYLHQADLVFQYIPPGSLSCFCHCAPLTEAHNPVYFALRRPEMYRKRHAVCLLESGVIYHNMAVAAMVHKVVEAWEQRHDRPTNVSGGTGTCTCQQRLLTPREQEIMIYMKQQMRVNEIASRMAISVQTVSNHKMNVMRKMGFQRNTELYYWLQRGIIADSSPAEPVT